MATNIANTSLEDILKNINDETGKIVTSEIINLFHDNGLTYKFKDDGSRYRIFCYIKKSKESVILSTMDMGKNFIVQLRITDRTVLDKLDDLSENVRSCMLNGPNCKESCFRQCETVYVFNYHDQVYHKCQALLCNFIFRDLRYEDIISLMDMIRNEIAYGKINSKTGKLARET